MPCVGVGLRPFSFFQAQSKHMSEQQIVLADEAATQSWAEALAQTLLRQLPSLPQGISISLHGDLGAGKTTLVRHLLRSMGVAGRIKSPSYAIVESYEAAGLALWHFDFYRLSCAEEWEDAGFRDIFAGAGLRLVEWPSLMPEGLVAYDLALHLALADKADADTGPRQLRAHALTAAGLQLLAAFT